LQECDYLRSIARPRLQISTVVDVATGKVHFLPYT
jgi:prolyl 4-hydroxylase